jgi:alpha-ketoglutarate-dependent taurine dioxygenase
MMNFLPVLKAVGFSVSGDFVDFVGSYQRPAAIPGTGLHNPLETPDGQAALAAAIEDFAPQLLDLADAIQGIVATNAGAVLVQGLGFERSAALHGEAVRDALVLALTSAIGEPTDHCADKRVMWPVNSRPVAAGKTATFSESLGEAPLHTDSAFSRNPERYNALYVVRQSRCGGGETVVVNGPRFLNDFAKTQQGAACIRFMRETDYAFRVPDAFFAGQRFITGKILSEDPMIRFRHDCIERGFDLCPDLATKEHRFYYSLFRTSAEAHASRSEFMMSDGDMIVFDNTRLFHARTDYQDPVRHLIRVRMHEREAVEQLRLVA